MAGTIGTDKVNVFPRAPLPSSFENSAILASRDRIHPRGGQRSTWSECPRLVPGSSGRPGSFVRHLGIWL